MYLGIRTDSPVAQFCLYDGAELKAEKTWQADRQLAHSLLGQLEAFLAEHDMTFHDVAGLFVYRGPGSFTGLRIGITVMNTIAYSESVPVVGSEGDDWQNDAVARLKNGQDDQVIIPFYGADPRITKPIK